MEVFVYKYLLRFVTIQDGQDESDHRSMNFRQHLEHSLISQGPSSLLFDSDASYVFFWEIFKPRTMSCGEAA